MYLSSICKFYKGLSTERILSKLLSWDLNAAIKIPGRICAESKDSVKEIMTFRAGGTGHLPFSQIPQILAYQLTLFQPNCYLPVSPDF